MQEVVIHLQMTTPALGCVEKRLPNGGVLYTMIRDGSDHVMFLPTWWKDGMQYAASVTNSCHTLVPQIAWATRVDGDVQRWRRNLRSNPGKRQRFAMHEAFRPRSVISVTAVLPTGLALPDFQQLLTTMGAYKGVSPYRTPTDSFGLFVVQSVTPKNSVR